MMLPVIDALTRVNRPWCRARRVMISSAALPKVALSRPPYWAPRCRATWPVAWPMSPASGTMPRHAVTKTSSGGAPRTRAITAIGAKTRRA